MVKLKRYIHHDKFKNNFNLAYFFQVFLYIGMTSHWRPKARGLVQHGGPPGWLEESEPAGVVLYVMERLYPCLFRTIPVALTGTAQLRADGISSCCELHHAEKAWPGSLVDPSLLSGYPHRYNK